MFRSFIYLGAILMKIAQLFILILAFLIINPVQAGLLVEPVLGYSFSKFEVDAPTFDEEKAVGPSLGGRLGYQKLGFQLGLDYLHSNLSVDDNDFKEDLKTNEFAAFAGFEFPILLRVYAGYIFSANGTSNVKVAGTNKSLKLDEGTGMKVGVGFTGLPFVDINFEYRKGTFGEYKVGGVKGSGDTDFSAFMVGVSLPFVL
jgi:hypothetical protein